MPISDSDPRVFFAAERTLLAWLRTGLTLMGFGFVIARFGLFLRLMSLQVAAPSHGPWSAVLGVAMVLVGAGVILLSSRQHGRYIATLAASDLPPRYARGFAIGTCLIVGLLGLVLAAYLGLTSF
ncbi:DUF202 domain-containing protein [Niveibacterium sp. SC-1]|uniref:YidH family protein n=1 Tax=Niveibacterium sp. SC-1 TaxID=3135646 RepID=UPI00311DF9A0